METTRELDTRGLNCPLPILKAKKALAEMASGELLRVVSTDPGSVRDFQAFARQTGNELVEQTQHGQRVRARAAAPLKRGPAGLGRSPGPGPTAPGSRRKARKPGPSCGCASASSTLASRKPSLLPQS